MIWEGDGEANAEAVKAVNILPRMLGYFQGTL